MTATPEGYFRRAETVTIKCFVKVGRHELAVGDRKDFL
jgi:hypothetical protein